MLLLGLGETPDGSRDGTVAASVAPATVSVSGFGSADPDATATAGAPIDRQAEWPRIPGYEIVGELGEGGGGKVYKAEQIKADRRIVAIKVLHGTSRIERERMFREARALGRISHPNIVTIYDVGETQDGPYFTMEYMAGGTLSQLIKKEKPNSEVSARIVEAIARGVGAAHAAGILHRDLKPSNVLLTADGTPKVSDFGLAKFEDGPADMSTLERVTPTGALLGTPAYMAPEQAAGRTKEVDERTDVYGIGAILYHCLTGRPPFRGETHFETAHRVIWEEIVPARSFDSTIDSELEAVCLRCLDKSQAVRYDSVEKVREDLVRKLSGQSTLARPHGIRTRLWRRFRRNRRTIAQWAIVVTLLVAVAIVMAEIRRPVDEKAKAREQLAWELANLDVVTLVGDKGLPRWSDWRQGAVHFSDSPFHDETCTFVTVTDSRLELVPFDLAPKAYVLEAEIRHNEADRVSPAEVGLYFKDHIWEKEDNYQATARYVLTFSEFAQAPKLKGKQKPIGPTMNVYPRAFIERPGEEDAAHRTNAALYPFQPVGSVPDSWRRFRIEVRPEKLRVFLWVGGRFDAFQPAEIPRDRLDAKSRELATELFPDRLKLGQLNAPSWEPAGALGLFATNSQVSYRNVTLTPIRTP